MLLTISTTHAPATDLGSLALREFALGIEALHRFVEHEPLYRVYECVLGVLALESEPVDPRL
jgi:protein phosphatase